MVNTVGHTIKRCKQPIAAEGDAGNGGFDNGGFDPIPEPVASSGDWDTGATTSGNWDTGTATGAVTGAATGVAW